MSAATSRTSVPFRVSNAKQVALEAESAKRIIDHLEGIINKLDNMIAKVQQEKRCVVEGMGEDARRVCLKIDSMTTNTCKP